MAKKKRVAPVVRPPTRRQLSHFQQQKRRQRIIFGAGMTIIAAVVILVASGVYFGWYVPVYRPLHETVAEANGTKFNMAYLIDFTQYTYGQYASMALEYGISDIQDAELIRQEAAKLGITVSDAEIDEALKGATEGTNKKNPALRGYVRMQLLSQKLRDEYFKPQLPATADQRQILAMFLESQSKANEIKASIETGTDFGLLAGEMSLDTTTKNDKGDLGFRPREVIAVLTGSTVLEDAIFSQEVGSLAQVEDKDKTKQVGYWLVKVTERKEDKSEAHVFGMLLGSEEEAARIKARLDAGEDFTDLAEEYSQAWDEDNKDDFGWIPSDSTDAAASYIFSENTGLNVVSAPIKDTNVATKGGYWLIKVAAAENREISEEDQSSMIGLLFNDWLEAIRANPDNHVESYLDETRKKWAVDYLGSLEA